MDEQVRRSVEDASGRIRQVVQLLAAAVVHHCPAIDRLGLLSRQMYADSSLLRANVSGRNLSPSSMSVEEFKDKAVEENGLFVLREWKVEEGGEEKRARRRLRLNFAVCEASGDSYAIYGYIDDGLAYKMCLGASLSPIKSPEEPDARKYMESLHPRPRSVAGPHP